MRRLSFNLLLLSAMLLGTSCSDNNDEGLEDGTASITVSIKGQPTTRTIGSSTANSEAENRVTNFTVFVFNYNSGALERSGSFNFSQDQLTGRITDINTGTRKRIVTLVNVPTDFQVSSITSYSQLDTNQITLESQNGTAVQTTGFFMTGQTDEAVTLTSGENSITIPVKRLVSKVVLKSLKYNADLTSLPNYALTGVSIQKARINGTPLANLVQPGGNDVDNYAGGVATPNGITPVFNLTYTFLNEALALPDGYTNNSDVIATANDERYFYVLPNDNTGNNATMLTLAAEFGEPTALSYYYPIVINGSEGQGSTDGTYVGSNKIYDISIVISHPDQPTEDPNTVPSVGVLNVTITPQDWENPIEQQVEW